MDGYLTKPVQVAELQKALRQVGSDASRGEAPLRIA
jgi:hypothetical protein